MKGHKVLFSHKNDDWETPQELFDELNKEFNFLYDIASSVDNKKAPLSPHNDIDSWDLMLDSFKNKMPLIEQWAWCNPPYSRQRKFVEFSIKHKLPTVFLLPARTDTKLFHELIYPYSNLKSNDSAIFPSMIVIHNSKNGTGSTPQVNSLSNELPYSMVVRFLKGRVKFIRSLNSINAIKLRIEELKEATARSRHVNDYILSDEIDIEIQRLEKSLKSNDSAGFPSMIVIYRPTKED